MRYREFSQKQNIQTPATTKFPIAATTTVANVPVIPDAVKHRRWQQQKAAEIAAAANSIKPTRDDFEKAFSIYASAQDVINAKYEYAKKYKKLKPT